jgi:hypothetical protein
MPPKSKPLPPSLDQVDALLRGKPKRPPGQGTVWVPTKESEASTLTGFWFEPQPWELGWDEWLARYGPSLRRTKHHPTVTFEAWMKANGIDPREVVSDSEEADAIGGQVFAKVNRTKREISRLMRLVEKVEHTRNLRQGWIAETSVREEQVPLDFGRTQDLAYARTVYKRLIRKAIADGKPVSAAARTLVQP